MVGLIKPEISNSKVWWRMEFTRSSPDEYVAVRSNPSLTKTNGHDPKTLTHQFVSSTPLLTQVINHRLFRTQKNPIQNSDLNSSTFYLPSSPATKNTLLHQLGLLFRWREALSDWIEAVGRKWVLEKRRMEVEEPIYGSRFYTLGVGIGWAPGSPVWWDPPPPFERVPFLSSLVFWSLL